VITGLKVIADVLLHGSAQVRFPKQDLVDGLKRLAEYRSGLDKARAEKKVLEIK